VTEIPEHLLQRSRQRREALGLSEPGAAPAPAEASAAIEATEAGAPAVPAVQPSAPAPIDTPPPPPKPDPPYVAAAKRRKRIPIWAMPVLVGLPIWAAIFAFTLEPPSAGASDPLTLGASLYVSAGCSGCHGANGEGGVGPSFQNGAVVETWPNWRNHFTWVFTGSADWPDPVYGATLKPIGSGGMPNFGGTLTDNQILLIVRYEREVLSGAPPEPDLDALTQCIADGEDLTVVLSPLEVPATGPGGTSEAPPAPESCAAG
jgi:mono/diheme cytochrome c family protein